MLKIIHRGCGGQYGWWTGHNPKDCDPILAETFMFMDGTHPKAGDLIDLTCPKCNQKARSWVDLERPIDNV